MHSLLLLAQPGTGHRVIHSFPTRRSSDLSGTFSGTSTVALTDAQVSALQAGGLYVNVHTALNGDRKSSRLNSSHHCVTCAPDCTLNIDRGTTTSATRTTTTTASTTTTTLA